MGLVDSLVSAGLSGVSKLFGKDPAEKMFKHSVQWRVEDANKAGVSPLFAMGAPVASPSTEVGGAAALGAMSQDLGRAAEAGMSGSGRAGNVSRMMETLSLRRADLENQVLEQQLINSKLATTRQVPSPSGPGGDRLLPGQGNSPLVKINPQDLTATRLGQSSEEPAPVPDRGFADTGTGFAPVLSRDMADRQADSVMEEMAWNVRNRLLPIFGANFNPPGGGKSDRGKIWAYDPLKSEYVQIDPNSWADRLRYSTPDGSSYPPIPRVSRKWGRGSSSYRR